LALGVTIGAFLIHRRKDQTAFSEAAPVAQGR
jgi:hypothetical protein